MTRSGMTFTILMITLASVVDAGEFLKTRPQSLMTALKAHAHHTSERISEFDAQTNLLEEIEIETGDGTVSTRLKQIEAILAPMYTALPKNERGYLSHATVHYALHRFFVEQYGWAIKGLDAVGSNSTSGAGLLKEQMPEKMQELFEQSLGGRGFGLHELAVLAATIKHLVHSDAIKRLGGAYKLHNYLPTSLLSVDEADDLLDSYMTTFIIVGGTRQEQNKTGFILAEDLSNKTLEGDLRLKSEMPDMFSSWTETKEFVRSMRHNVTKSADSALQEASGELGFSTLARVAERVNEDYGRFQDGDCQQIKAALVSVEEHGTGRVHLPDFYKATPPGSGFRFAESLKYLRQLGALDETDPSKPRVIIANYIQAPINCIASSTFYDVCCRDECEGLIGHLEEQIAAPESTPARIAVLVAELSSTSVVAPRKLSEKMLARLEEISAGHGGSVPLHGRLFAQWMHHAFPRECPFPHPTGAVKPATPDELLEAPLIAGSTGGVTAAVTEEPIRKEKRTEYEVGGEAIVVSGGTEEAAVEGKVLQEELPWSPQEELLVARTTKVQPAPVQSIFGATLRKGLLFTSMIAIAYGLKFGQQSKTGADKETGIIEKFFV